MRACKLFPVGCYNDWTRLPRMKSQAAEYREKWVRRRHRHAERHRAPVAHPVGDSLNEAANHPLVDLAEQAEHAAIFFV